MNNPGLAAFAAPFVRPKNHPAFGDINDDVDQDRRVDPEEDDEGYGDDEHEFVRPEAFGRWQTPGQAIRVGPATVGPRIKDAEDDIQGEIITLRESAAADGIMDGDHERPTPSANPDVEEARRKLREPGSDVAVHAVSSMLQGAPPSDVDMGTAHDYLSQHFTGVRVNPRTGTMVATSPHGTQLVRRSQAGLPALRHKPLYTLTNKHGEITSEDPESLVRAAVAFQIVHNSIAQQQQKEKDKEDRDRASTGITAVGGLRDFINYFRPSTSPGYRADPKVEPVKPTAAPASAVFEPGNGSDIGPGGQRGGYVVHTVDAPSDWHHDSVSGVSYSPGHSMKLTLDPAEAQIPRADPVYKGHTFSYGPSAEHPIQITPKGGTPYWVSGLHPDARGRSAPSAPGPGRRRPTTPHRPAGPPPQIGGTPRRTSAVKTNDLCPVCASGYLEPYSDEHHECLNCGSLVKHAARPKGGLGRGLGQILQPVGDPLKLEEGGSEAEGFESPEPGVHPLHGEENQSDEPGYEAPRNILDKESATEQFDPLDEHLGKLGFTPIHKPGAAERTYVMQMPHAPAGAYARLTEGVGGRGWVLTADTVNGREKWTDAEGKPVRGFGYQTETTENMPNPGRKMRQLLPEQANRPMAEKSFLANGHHPIHDDNLNRAIRDVAENGRNSRTYWDSVLDTAHEPPQQPGASIPGMPYHPAEQRRLRGLSSLENPGLQRWSG